MKRIFIALAMLLLFPAMIYAMNPPKYENPYSGANKTVGNSTKSGDPIYTNSGSIDFVLPLLYPGGPMDLSFDFMYNRAINNWWGGPGNYFPANNGGTNYFWFTPFSAGTSWHDIHLLSGDRVSFHEDDGVYVLFEEEMDDYKENGSTIKYAAKATTGPDRFWVMDPVREQVLVYNLDTQGILYLLDRNGNKLSYTYRDDDRLDEITDGFGRKLAFTYTDVGGKTYLNTVSDQTDPANPRTVTFGYDATAAEMGDKPVLRSITDAMGQIYSFRWSAVIDGGNTYWDNLVKVEKPKGADYYDVENTWDYISYQNAQGEGRYGIKVVSQKDPYNNETTFSYNNSPYYTEETTPEGGTSKFYHNNAHVPPSQFEDQTGKSMQFTKDAHNRVTSVTDRMENNTKVTYHNETGFISSITNAEDKTTVFSYTAQEQTFTIVDGEATFTFYNLTRVDYPDGTCEEHTYDDHGNLVTFTDKRGKQWNYEYDEKGMLSKTTRPTGSETSYTYDAHGNQASIQNSESGTTSYTYNNWNRLKKITFPDEKFFGIEFNANDQITCFTNEMGKQYTFQYDLNGNLIKATDPYDKYESYEYNQMDKIKKYTNRKGDIFETEYDSMNRIKKIKTTNPNGTTVFSEFMYNSRGWPDKIKNNDNSEWQISYDDEGLIKSVTDAEGNVVSSQRDRLGRMTKFTDELGHDINFDLDALGRVTKIRDRLARETTFVYNDWGLPSSMSQTGLGAIHLSYNDIGLLTTLKDLNESEWHFGYSELGYLISYQDPLGNTADINRGNSTKITGIDYADGSWAKYYYDDAGNVIKMEYSDGKEINIGYDDLYRMTTLGDMIADYNDEGKLINTRTPSEFFGVEYSHGKIVKATYNGILEVAYIYDSLNRVVKIEDNLTNSWVEFKYDKNDFATKIERSNGVSTTFERDAAGRITKMIEGTALEPDSLSSLGYTLNAGGEVIRLNYNLQLNPADYLTHSQDTYTYNAAHEVADDGYSYDKLGELTSEPSTNYSWSARGKLKEINNSVTMEYNARGDIKERKEAEITQDYFYNYGLPAKPIAAEKVNGNWKRFYIYHACAGLFYFIDYTDTSNPKAYFYHYDRIGSAMFLTDADGNVSDKYAYAPYGRLLHHDGSSDQPFLFVAYDGVRYENDSFYEMGARYYDVKTSRFISRDPSWPVLDPLEVNPYIYALDSPVTYKDANGESLKGDAAKFAAGQGLDYLVNKILGNGFDRGAFLQVLKGLLKKVDKLDGANKRNARKAVGKWVHRVAKKASCTLKGQFVDEGKLKELGEMLSDSRYNMWGSYKHYTLMKSMDDMCAPLGWAAEIIGGMGATVFEWMGNAPVFGSCRATSLTPPIIAKKKRATSSTVEYQESKQRDVPPLNILTVTLWGDKTIGKTGAVKKLIKKAGGQVPTGYRRFLVRKPTPEGVVRGRKTIPKIPSRKKPPEEEKTPPGSDHAPKDNPGNGPCECRNIF